MLMDDDLRKDSRKEKPKPVRDKQPQIKDNQENLKNSSEEDKRNSEPKCSKVEKPRISIEDLWKYTPVEEKSDTLTNERNNFINQGEDKKGTDRLEADNRKEKSNEGMFRQRDGLSPRENKIDYTEYADRMMKGKDLPAKNSDGELNIYSNKSIGMLDNNVKYNYSQLKDLKEVRMDGKTAYNRKVRSSTNAPYEEYKKATNDIETHRFTSPEDTWDFYLNYKNQESLQKLDNHVENLKKMEALMSNTKHRIEAFFKNSQKKFLANPTINNCLDYTTMRRIMDKRDIDYEHIFDIKNFKEADMGKFILSTIKDITLLDLKEKWAIKFFPRAEGIDIRINNNPAISELEFKKVLANINNHSVEKVKLEGQSNIFINNGYLYEASNIKNIELETKLNDIEYVLKIEFEKSIMNVSVRKDHIKEREKLEDRVSAPKILALRINEGLIYYNERHEEILVSNDQVKDITEFGEKRKKMYEKFLKPFVNSDILNVRFDNS